MSAPIDTKNQNKSRLPSPEHAFEWPRQAMRERQWSEAAQRWAVLREAYPEHPATWLQGAATHIKADELDKAEDLLGFAQQNFPNHPQTLTESAELAIRQNRWDAVEVFLQQTRDKFPDNLQTWLKSADYAERRGNHELAEDYNEKARLCEPDKSEPFIQHAEQAMRAGEWDKALERWEIVRNHFPDIPAGYLRAAEAAQRLNLFKEAKKLRLVQQYGADIFDHAKNKSDTLAPKSKSKSIVRFMELIWTKAIFNLRSEVHRNYLSYGWWVLEPLLHMLVYYVVFGILLQRGGESFPVFLLTGLIPWMWFNKAVSGSSNSILAGQNVMLQVGLPSIVFPLTSILQVTLKQLPVFLLLFCFLWVQGFSPNLYWWSLFPLIIVQILLITAFASAVAAIIPFVRDLSYLVPTGLTFLMFVSGIFYDYRTIPEEWQDLFLLNPIAFLLKSYREVLMDGILPDYLVLGWWGIGSIVACLLMLLSYQKLRYIYPRIVLE